MIKKSWYLSSRGLQMSSIFRIAVLAIVFSSCTFSTSNFNLEADKAAAKQITAGFYEKLSARHYKETYPFFIKAFFSKVDTSSLNGLYKHYEDKLGTINKFSLLKCETKRTNKSDKQLCTYLLVFKVNRSKGVTKESFLMQSEDDKEPKIFRYDIFERPTGVGEKLKK